MRWRRSRVNREGLDRELDKELRFHLDRRVEDYRGLPPEEARRRARAEFGGGQQIRERCREVHRLRWFDDLSRDLRISIRTLRWARGFSIVAVATLALGIGANSAVFSAIDTVLLRPLPFPDGDRLMRLRQRQDRTSETLIAPVRLEDWNRLNSTFEAITGYYTEDVSETSGDLPERVRRANVAPRFLVVWGIASALGRDFDRAEHQVGGPQAVLISDRYWRSRFGADPNVLNRVVRLGSLSFSIVGVMPASFLFMDRDVDLWFPVAVDAPYAQPRQNTWYVGLGLLLRSFQELSRVAPGFESSRVLSFRISGGYGETADYGRLIQRIDGTLDELRALHPRPLGHALRCFSFRSSNALGGRRDRAGGRRSGGPASRARAALLDSMRVLRED